MALARGAFCFFLSYGFLKFKKRVLLLMSCLKPTFFSRTPALGSWEGCLY